MKANGECALLLCAQLCLFHCCAFHMNTRNSYWLERLIMQILQVLYGDFKRFNEHGVENYTYQVIVLDIDSFALFPPYRSQIFFLAWQTPTHSQKYISSKNLLYPFLPTKIGMCGSLLCSQSTPSTLISLIVLFIHSHILFANIYWMFTII